MFSNDQHDPDCPFHQPYACAAPRIKVAERPKHHPQADMAVKGALLRIVGADGEPLTEPGTECDLIGMFLRRYRGEIGWKGDLTAVALHFMDHLEMPLPMVMMWTNIAATMHPEVLAEDLKGRLS